MIGVGFILSAILGVLKPLWPYIVAAVVALGWGFHQRLAGAKAERSKQAEQETAARDIRDQVQNDIGAMPADKVREELAKRAAK